MHELLMRPGLRRQQDALFDQVDLDVEFVDGDPVAEVPVKTVGFLYQHQKATAVLAGKGDHMAEGGTARLLGGLDVNEFLQDLQLTASSIRSQQIELRRDRVAFALLILRGDSSVEDGRIGHGI